MGQHRASRNAHYRAAFLLLLLLPVASCTASEGEPGPETDQTVVATGLRAPWSVVPLADGGALISQRDDAQVRELTATGALRTVGTVPGVVSGGEAGLNGLAVQEREGVRWLYAYHATGEDNRVVRLPLSGAPGALTFDAGLAQVVLDGIPRAGNHNGGRIAFGPDGNLYIATGDAGQRNRARDPLFLGGKILRVTADGEPAPGNPFGTAVYSLGHRNVQGIAWDEAGTMWASEFGQDTWDELNRIEPGGDYGWPEYEGMAGAADAIDPVLVWAPAEASPSGIAVIDGIVHVAGLRGERLWRYDPAHPERGAEVTPLSDTYGRLRDVVAGPDGAVWILTNNTDGRGTPGAGDDRLVVLNRRML